MINLERLRNFYYHHQSENIHALKTGVAFILGYIATLILPGKSPWVLITITVIMLSQAVLGLQINKAFMRMLGTLVGALIGIITMSVVHDAIYIPILLIVFAILSSKLAIRFPNFSYAVILGVVTFLLIIFMPDYSIKYALNRLSDILSGIIICLMVSALIFPLNAKRSFLFSIISNFKNLKNLAFLVFLEGKERRQDPQLIYLESKIGSQLTEQRNLIKASDYEKINSKNIKNDLFRIHRCQRAIFHYLILIDVILYESRPNLSKDFLHQFNRFISELMVFLDSFDLGKNIYIPESLSLEFKSFEQIIEEYFVKQNLEIIDKQSKGALLFTIGRMKIILKIIVMHWNNIVKSSCK